MVKGIQSLHRDLCQVLLLGNRPPIPDPSPVLNDPKDQGAGRSRAAAPAGLLHRLPGAADLCGDEAGARRNWASTMSRPTSAATCSRSCRRSTSATRRWATALAPACASAFNVQADKRAISVMGDGGFWHNGLASVDRQRGVQQAGRRDPRRRQLLFGRHRRAGHPVVARRQPAPQDQQFRSTMRCKGVGATWVRQIDRTYDVAKMRDTLREALTTKEKGPKIIVASSRMHAQQAAPREAAVRARRSSDGKRMVQGALRRRRGRLHRRPCLHPAVGLPVAVGQARPTIRCKRRSGRRDRQQLRRLRQLRRGRRRPPCCARPSTAPTSSTTRPAGTASWPRMRGAVIGWLQAAGRAPDRCLRSEDAT